MPTRLVNKFHKRATAIPPLRILTEEDNAKLVAAAKNGWIGVKLPGKLEDKASLAAMTFRR